MGDVCGHGLGAALFATAARALIRSGLADGRDPVEVIERANRFLHRDMPQGRFLTLFLGVHDPARETLWFVNAGQSPPLVLAGEDVFELSGTGIPLGLDDGIPFGPGEEAPLRPGHTLLAYTDGLIEARDGAGEFFGTERVARLLRAKGPAAALDTLVEGVRDDLYAFAGRDGVSDDLALLAYRPGPVPALAGVS
jgi:serine phosphatase RsbU (regulator of sigma subunit)